VILAIALAQLTRADSTVQEVQQELKEQGYYFGQINGEKDADTIAAMADGFGVRTAELTAAVGPGIGRCCFAVGQEVARGA